MCLQYACIFFPYKSVCICIRICVFICVCVRSLSLRSCVRWILYWYAYPSGCFFFFFISCFLRCSDDTFPFNWPIVGASMYRGGEEGSVEQMPSCQRTKNPSVTLSSPLLAAPSSFHRPRIKVALCIWKGPRLYATQISLSPALPDSFHKKHPHICATSVKEGPHLQGLPFFSALSSPLSQIAVPFSPLNYGCQGRRRERREWDRGRISHSEIKRKGVNEKKKGGRFRDGKKTHTRQERRRKQKTGAERTRKRKETLTNDFFLSAVILLLMHCGSVGTFSHSAPFISSPCFFFSSTATPYPAPSSTHTQTHPLLISKQAEPMKVNNCPLSWKCPPLVEMEWGVCVHPEQTSSQSDSHMWRSGVFKLSQLTALALERVGKSQGKLGGVRLQRGYIHCIYKLVDQWELYLQRKKERKMAAI